MFGQGGYGSELRHRLPPPPPPPLYQQAHSLPPPPPPPLYQQQGSAPAPHAFFQQGSVPPPPPAFQNPSSFQQPLSIPPPPPPTRLPPPPPPPALGVQPGQPQPVSHPYQYAHERPTSLGNIGRPYLPPPPPPPSTYGGSIPGPVNQPQAPGGPSNPMLVANQNMHQVPQYQHPSHGVRPPSQGQGLPVPGIQHYPLPPPPPPNVVPQAPAPFTPFLQGNANEFQPPSSPPPPPPPLPSSPPPLPSSPPPDVEMPPADTFVDIISEDGHVDVALPTTSDTFHGESSHPSEVLATSTGEETCTGLVPSEDVTPNGSPPSQNEQSLQNNFDGSAKLNDSDMDMEDDGDFSEPDIELKYGEFDNRFQESRSLNSNPVDVTGELSTSSRDMSQHQLNHLSPAVEGLCGEVCQNIKLQLALWKVPNDQLIARPNIQSVAILKDKNGCCPTS